MINELLSVADDLAAWGVDVPASGLTTRLQPNTALVLPKGETAFVRAVFSNKTVAFYDFPEGKALHHYRVGSNGPPKGITYEAVKGNPKADVYGSAAEGVQKWYAQFVGVVTEIYHEVRHGCPPALQTLIANLHGDEALAVSPVVFEQQLVAFRDRRGWSPKTKIVVCADTDRRPIVQTADFFRDLSDAIKAKPSSGTDALGSPLAGHDNTMGLTAKTYAVGPVKIFSRNEAIRCLTRWGQNSVGTFRMGTETRDRIVRLAEFLLGQEQQLTREQKGIWYVVPSSREVRKKNRAAPTDFVLTTMFPGTNIFDAPGEDIDSAAWADALSGLALAYRTGTKEPEKYVGRVLFGRKIDDKSKIWQLRAAMTMTREDIAAYVTEWRAYRDYMKHAVYGVKMEPPALPQVHYFLNRIYRQSGKVIVSDPKALIPLETVYGAFATKVEGGTIVGHADALAALTAFCANRLPYLFHKADTLRRQWDRSFRTLLPLVYVLFHKNLRGSPMEKSWAFVMGQVLGYSNDLYREWFRSRGLNSPEYTLAQRSLPLVNVAPASGFAQFQDQMGRCLGWYESRRSDTAEGTRADFARSFMRLGRYTKLIGLLRKATPAIPNTMTPNEKIALHAGYYAPFLNPDEPDADADPAATPVAAAS